MLQLYSTDGDYSVVNNNEVEWAKLFMEFILGTAFCQGRTCQGEVFVFIVVPAPRTLGAKACCHNVCGHVSHAACKTGRSSYRTEQHSTGFQRNA